MMPRTLVQKVNKKFWEDSERILKEMMLLNIEDICEKICMYDDMDFSAHVLD